MEITTSETITLWPLLLYFGAVMFVVGGMVGLSYVLGQRHHDQATGEPYESGIIPMGAARLRLSAKFYLVAMLFVIFDLEVAFIVAWAIAFRQADGLNRRLGPAQGPGGWIAGGEGLSFNSSCGSSS